MAKKTTTTRKAVAKKATTRKPVAHRVAAGRASSAKPRQSTAKKATARKATPKKPVAKKATTRKPATRRPASNQHPSVAFIEAMTADVMNVIDQLSNFASNLRALDRQRHNGVGMKRLGFIEAAFRISTMFPQYFPHWLDTAKFKSDLDLFNAIRSLVEACRSLEEKAWNINVESSDMIYTNALEYYSQVQDAAERRIDSAESLYAELHGFFSNMGKHETPDQPTKKKTKRDINALMKGKKDGEIIIRNISPRTSGGTREIIDETFKNSAQFKESESVSREQ